MKTWKVRFIIQRYGSDIIPAETAQEAERLVSSRLSIDYQNSLFGYILLDETKEE